jgi:spectinomycin phosphotransferase
MLEKPEIKDERIINCLRVEFGLDVKNISYLSLGADVDTSVYHAITKHGTNYFVKVRRGNFSEASVTIPSFLSASGIKQVVPPLMTQKGQLWASLNPFKVILYPFVEGQAGLDIKMSKQQWFEFGTALRQFHTTDFPRQLTSSIQKDDFSSRWRETVNMHLERVAEEVSNEPIKVEASDLLRSKRSETLEVVNRAEQLARRLQADLPEFILSHGDIHGYNLLIDTQGALYIVDWDGLLFAPKERDLMFIGGGHGNSGYPPQEEEAMFYQGYGETNINQIAIAYYRYERIVLDIVDDCHIIFLSDEGEENQAGALEDLKNKFLPDSYIAIAYQSDKVSKN